MPVTHVNGKLTVGLSPNLETVQRTLFLVGKLLVTVPLADVRQYVEEIDQVAIEGPLFDPSSWITVQETYRGHRQFAAACLQLRQVCDQFLTEPPADEPTDQEGQSHDRSEPPSSQ